MKVAFTVAKAQVQSLDAALMTIMIGSLSRWNDASDTVLNYARSRVFAALMKDRVRLCSLIDYLQINSTLHLDCLLLYRYALRLIFDASIRGLQ